MIALLFSLFACQPQVATLQANASDEAAWVADLAAGSTRLLVPQVASSELVTRAIPGPRGTQLTLAASAGAGFQVESFTVQLVSHSHDERVLLFDGEPFLVCGERLPVDVVESSSKNSRLARLARQDQVGVRGEVLGVPAGPGASDLVLLPLASAAAPMPIEVRAPGGTWRALSWVAVPGAALRLDGSHDWEIRAGDTGIDQLFHASTRAVDDAITMECSSRSIARSESRVIQRGDQAPAHVLLLSAERGTRHTSVAGQGCVANGLLQIGIPRGATPGESRSATFLIDVTLQAKDPSVAIDGTFTRRAPALLRDVAPRAGLQDVHLEGPAAQLDIRPTMGPGAAWGDFDGDGWTDLYVVQGGGREGSAKPANRLMRNLGNGTFEHVPGAADTGAGMGALFFDLDGDGDLDLYVANYGPDVLYRNDGEGGFSDVSTEHTLANSEWSAGLCAGDYDRDGDLDLYVTSYLVYDTSLMPPVEQLPGYAREDPIEMLPFAFPGAANTFLENVDGTLVDRTEQLGLADEQGRGMQPVFWDFDLDGDLDLYVANDVSMNVLYRNEGDGSFKDISFQVGMDDPRGGMGVATGDVDFDGDLDLFLTNWELEANALYRNNHISRTGRKSHMGTFQDVTVHSKLGRDSIGKTSWGGVFFDADNDGDLDLFVPNGYTSPDYEGTSICVGQSNQLFLNDGNGRFEDVSERAGPAVTNALASRTAAVCDYDGDGRLDLFVTNNNGPYQLLHNEFDSGNHWFGVRLVGRNGNTSAVGARAVLEVDGVRLVRQVRAGGGYLAGHANGLHFGLGNEQEVSELTIHWPSGQVSAHAIDKLDAWITIAEPALPGADSK